jgi:hypothetical protein
MFLKAASSALALAVCLVAGAGIATGSSRSADVSVTNVESPDPVAKGQQVSYTVVVRNNGPTRAWGVTATEVLPPWVDLKWFKTTQGTCASSKLGDAFIVRCSVGTVWGGRAATITIGATPSTVGTITASASATSTSPTDPNLRNNTALATTTVASATTTTADTTPPVVSVPSDQRVEAQGPLGAADSYPPASALDAIDGPVSVLCSPGSGSLFPLGSTRVGCTASDTSGNTAVAFFTVSVVDTTPPKLTAPAGIAVTADSASGTSRTNATVAAFLSAAVATDLVTATPTITTNAPDMFPVGTTQVVFTASDASGNKATATASVTVQGATTTAGTTTTGTTTTGTTTGTTTTTPAPTGSVLWRGDAETSNFSQWTGGGSCLVQASRVAGSCYGLTNCTFGGYGTGDGDVQIVSSPVHGAGSTKAYKHTIYQQTSGTGCGGDNTVRADLYLPSDTAYGQAAMGVPLQGKEQYWHFAFMLPSVNGQPQQWSQYYNWNALGDMHPADGGSALSPVDFGVVDTGTQHFIYSERIDEPNGCFDCDFIQAAPLVYDKWIDVIFFIRWSTDPSVGHVTIWTNVAGAGYVQKFDKTYRTLIAGQLPYWKEALYTGIGPNQTARTMTNTVIYDGTCRGTTFAVVATC